MVRAELDIIIAVFWTFVHEIKSTTILYPLLATTDIFGDSKKAQVAACSTIKAVYRTAKVSVSRHYRNTLNKVHTLVGGLPVVLLSYCILGRAA